MPTVIIAGHMTIDADKRAAALAAGEPQIAGALTEPGCEAYAWTPDPYVADRLHVFERWTDSESLVLHLAGPWYKAMLKVLGAHGIHDAHVVKYRVDLAEPVYDDTGTPRGDFFTA